MMRGLSGNKALFLVQKLGLIYSIHQMKELIFHYLLIYMILRINIEVENSL